jgi:hypothetical protein
MSNAAPAPCAMRAPISAIGVGAKPQAMEVPTKG